MERLICLECGSQKNFIREESVKEFATRTVYLDKYGEYEDIGDYDYSDCEVIDEYPICCTTCKSEQIEKVDEEDFDFFVWKHTYKGKWHKEELEKEKRDMAVYDTLLAGRL